MTGKALLSGLFLLMAAGSFAPPALAQQNVPDLQAGFSAGVALPTDEQFREFYGSAQFVIAGQVDVRACRRFLVFSGYGYRDRTGNAEGSRDPLKFRMHTFKLGGLYALPLGSVLIKAGAGIGIFNYKETWEAAGVVTSGTKPGFLLQAGVERTITGPIAVVGRIEYSHVRADEINLGGLDLSAGLIFRLK
jgi:opacity protein-like surface antigen